MDEITTFILTVLLWFPSPILDCLLFPPLEILLEFLGSVQVGDALGSDGLLGLVSLGLVLDRVQEILHCMLIQSEGGTVTKYF